MTGVVDAAEASRLVAALLPLTETGHDVTLDLYEVTLLDAAGIAALTDCAATARANGGRLRVCHAHGVVLEALELTGTAEALGARAAADMSPGSTTARAGRRALIDDEAVRRALRRLAALPADDPDRDRLRSAIIETCRPFAAGLAGRYRGRSEPLEDLVQVAAVGLIKAVDGYDPGWQRPFVSYALPTILGELKRYFRDRCWTVRPPRRLQELRSAILASRSELAQSLGRTPTVTDVADHLDVDEECVVAAMHAWGGYRPVSLSVPVGESGGDELADLIGAPDGAYERVDNHLALLSLVKRLPPRERSILALRFSGELSQAQIGKRLGISQMHVSRLLSRTLAMLRRGLVEGA